MATGSLGGVYAIRCTANDRIYVGSSKNIRCRLNQHRHSLRQGTHHSVLLQRAWKKYGEAAFEFSVLESVADESKLFGREQVFIDRFDSAHPSKGFNIHPLANGPRGVRRTQAQKDALRAHMLSLPDLPERMARLANATRGRKRGPMPPEVREKIAAAHRGVRMSPERIAKMSAAKKGRPLPRSHRDKMVAALRAHYAARPRNPRPLPKRFRMDAEVLRAGIVLYKCGATTAELVPVLGFTPTGWARALNRSGVSMGRKGAHPGVPRPAAKVKRDNARAA